MSDLSTPSMPDIPAPSLQNLRQALTALKGAVGGFELPTPDTPDRPGPDDAPWEGPILLRDLITDIQHFIDRLDGYRLHTPSALEILDVEVTQSIQFCNVDGHSSGAAADGAVRLVANKVTVLRVYVERRLGPTGYVPRRFTGEVRVAGQVLKALNGPRPLRTKGSLRRSRIDDSLNFRIPASLCVGVREFNILVHDADQPVLTGGISEDYHRPGRSSVSTLCGAHFWPQPPLRVRGVLLAYAGPDTPTRSFDLPAPAATALIDTLARCLPMLPIQGFDFGPCTTHTVLDDMRKQPPMPNNGWQNTLNMLANLRSASTLRTHFVGLLPKGLPATLGSGTKGIGRPGCAIAPQDHTRAMSHELGHACWLPHLNDGYALEPWDTTYPTYGTFPPFSIGEFGLDTARMALFDPNAAHDFMSYFDGDDVPYPPHIWISPHNYTKLLRNILDSDGTGDFTVSVTVVPSAMMLNFRLYRDGRVELQPSWRVTQVPPQSAPPSALPVRLDLLGHDGEVRDSRRCHLHTGNNDPDGVFVDFHELVPWSDDIAGFAVVRDGRVLATVKNDGRPPRVELRELRRVSRGADLAQLHWSVDAGEAPHAALVRYTNDDGRTYHALAAGLSVAEHVVNLALLPGGERCRLEVTVASGLHSVTVQTPPFKVALKPRTARIVSPRDGQQFARGAPVVLLGAGHSPDGGVCAPDEVAWHSNIEGFLGSGHHLICDELRPGLHHITASLPDGQHGQANASVWIRVGEEAASCAPSGARSNDDATPG